MPGTRACVCLTFECVFDGRRCDTGRLSKPPRLCLLRAVIINCYTRQNTRGVSRVSQRTRRGRGSDVSSLARGASSNACTVGPLPFRDNGHYSGTNMPLRHALMLSFDCVIQDMCARNRTKPT
ncbi:Uncharacterized protein PBTT_04474 [Plasmodiophora brassicae]